MPLRIKINKLRLDEECVLQPEMYYEVATELADEKYNLEMLRNEEEIIKAELDAAIRESPSAFKVDKITDTAVNAAIARSKRLQDHKKKTAKCKHRMDILIAAQIALEHRKRALQDLCYLHGQNYFSAPISGDRKGREGRRNQVEDEDE